MRTFLEKLYQYFSTETDSGVYILTIKKISWVVICISIFSRLIRYIDNYSFWGDDAFLAINIIDRTFFELLSPLDHFQMAPIGFLLIVKCIVNVLGFSEFNFRAVPFIAGIGSFYLFYLVAKELLREKEIAIAMILFAVADPLVFYSIEFKSYSLDVFVCLIIILLTLKIIKYETTNREFIYFALTGILSVWFSLSAAFVCAGAGLTLLVFYWKIDHFRLKIILITVLWLISFLLEYSLLNASPELSLYMKTFWIRHFAPPPITLVNFKWYVETFFNFFNDPVGLPKVKMTGAVFLFGFSLFYKEKRLYSLLLISPIGIILFVSIFKLIPFPTSDLSPYLANFVSDSGLSFFEQLKPIYPYIGRVILFSAPLALIFIAKGCGFLVFRRNVIVRLIGIVLITYIVFIPFMALVLNTISPPKIVEARPLLKKLKLQYKPGDKIYS